MYEISATTAADYLRESARIAASEPVHVRELPGGVSNIVLLVTLPTRGERFVLKQARGQLRVREEWLCPVERIWREVEVLRVCEGLLRNTGDSGGMTRAKHKALDWFSPGVPQVNWEDRENYCYAMTAAPSRNRTWKAMLLDGPSMLDPYIAVACGRLLGRLHAGSWRDAGLAASLEDRTYFDLLRLDPYYSHAANANSDLAAQFTKLIDSVWNNRLCLVHGDFSPKNLLIWWRNVWLIDHEVGHFGDPAFDLGFFLTHLVAKAVHARVECRHFLALAGIFWQTYRTQLARVAAPDELADLKQRMLLNLAGCLLARVDGKSPLEYLSDHERHVIQQLGREWLITPPDRLTNLD
jgi:5-methylthioribose kinase